MTTIHKIGTGTISGTGYVDLLDRTKYFVVVGDDASQVEREITSTCVAPCSPVGGSAILKKSRIPYVKRPLTVYCKNSTYQSALDSAEAIMEIINDARASNLSMSCTDVSTVTSTPQQYSVMQIGNQTLPSVYTILDGNYDFTRRELSSLWIIVLKVELLLMTGAAFLDGSGFPASGVNTPSLPM